jgi:hypothetical protein
MAKANIHDRTTLKRVYPPEAFSDDAARNSAASPEIVRGVRLLRGPDAAGEFEFEPGSRAVGEMPSAAFLAPYRSVPNAPSAGAASGPPAGYEAFLDDIIDAARRFGFQPGETPGQGDPRIRGLRQ